MWIQNESYMNFVILTGSRNWEEWVIWGSTSNKRLGISLPVRRKSEITQNSLSITNNILYRVRSFHNFKENTNCIHISIYNKSSSLRHKHTSRAMDASKNPVKLVKVTRVLGRTGLSPRNPAFPSSLLTNHRLSWRRDSGQGGIHGRSNSFYNPKRKGGW